MKKKILVMLFLIIAVFIGYRAYNKQHEVILDVLTLYGNVEIRQVDLGFRVEGRIKEMFVEEGDFVEKDQLLAFLEDENYQSTYEKNLADIKALKATGTNAISQYERHIPLCASGTTSKLECDNLKSTMDNSIASLEALEASLIGNKKNLEDTKLYAPDNGIITVRIQEPGAIVQPSTPIYTMAKLYPVWIRTYIPETNLANIKYGMKAKVITDTIDPNTGKLREYEGQVGYISPVAEFTPKTVQTEDLRTNLVYRVRIYVYDIDEYLRQGMPTTIKLDLSNE